MQHECAGCSKHDGEHACQYLPPTHTAQGDFEAVAYQAFSISRSTTQPSLRLHDGSPSEDIRALEAELRQGLSLVIQDASRPWLWLFQPATVEKAEAGQGAVELPELDGYCLQRKESLVSLRLMLMLSRRTIRIHKGYRAISTAAPSIKLYSVCGF